MINVENSAQPLNEGGKPSGTDGNGRLYGRDVPYLSPLCERFLQ
jgi:hypothetical protein